MSNGEPPAIDRGVIDRLRQLNEDGQPDVVSEVFGLFFADAPARLDAVAAAVAARDAAGLRRAAHTLKGAAGAIGAANLQAVCRRLEEMGAHQTFDRVDEALAAMRQEYRRVKDAADQLL
jgi:HPt (histidine-containing phosphotransfer) domain-containing protein